MGEKKARYFHAVWDAEKGEVVPGSPLGPKRGEGANPPEKNGVVFFRVYSKNLLVLLGERDDDEKKPGKKKRRYSMSDFGLLSAMMAFAEWGTNKLVDPATKRYMTISDLAEKLGMVRKHMTYSLAWLEEKGFVKTLPQEDGSKQIMVNSQLMWYGKEMLNIDEQFKAFNPVDPVTGEYVPVYKPECPVVYKERRKKEEKSNG